MQRLFKFTLICLVVAFTSWSAMAQQSRTFSVSGFNRLAMGSAFKIDVKQGASYSVTAEGRSEDLSDIESSVSGGELKLRYKNNGWNKNRKTVHVRITMPNLQGVDFSGATEVTVGRFSGVKNMDIEVSGASKVSMELAAQKVSMDLSGASSLVLVGKCDVLNGEVSGASSFKGKDFPAREVNIEASGASSAAVVASAAIHAEASGASSIRYSGDAKDIHSSTSGASSVKRQ
ncbi:head GIN domain-containing protein [Dyadobacter sp. 32]|uniref:head GIN domain-containing protein n=1 Tax=Dyadobacter sp. 32 TaxID=538966 RepID=UPI0011EE8C94